MPNEKQIKALNELLFGLYQSNANSLTEFKPNHSIRNLIGNDENIYTTFKYTHGADGGIEIDDVYILISPEGDIQNMIEKHNELYLKEFFSNLKPLNF